MGDWIQCVRCGRNMDDHTVECNEEGRRCAPVPFQKFDTDKPRPELIPPHALGEIAAVLACGARKYGVGNWRRCDDGSRYVGAFLRHVLAYMRGERTDPETGRHVLAHAACCVLFLLDLELAPPGAEPPEGKG